MERRMRASRQRVALHNITGEVVGHAIVDANDFVRVNAFAWYLGTDGYARRTVKVAGRNRTLLMHRFVMGLVFSDPRQVDHRDWDGLNNVRSNLRVCSGNQQNHQNRKPIGGTSRYRGVSWHKGKGKWQAKAQLYGVCYFIGAFVSEMEANAAAIAWRAEHMPFSQDAEVGART